jgi:branched-chain amino acid transport system substrate-binding protein
MEDPVGTGRRFRRRRWLFALAVAVVAAGLVAAGCGSSSKSSSTSSSSAGTGTTTSASTKGSPIVVYTFADVNTQGPQYKNIAETARVWGDYTNAHGGINGHPVNVKFCDAKGTPTDATACARQAVADHAVAVVGSFTFTGDAITPILQAGKVAYFGNCCAVSPTEFTSPDSFPMGDQPLYAVGLVKRAAQDGCKKMVGVIIQGAETFEPLMTNAAKALGKTIKYVSLPATARDYSPQVAEATSGGTDCIIMIVSETPYIAWMPAFTQSGSKARMYGPQGNLDEKVIAAAPHSVTNGDVIAAMFPSFTLSQWAPYRNALSQYHADPNQLYDTFGGQGTWAAYEGFKQIVQKMLASGLPVNNTTFLNQANTSQLNLPGLYPPIDFTKPWIKIGGPKGYDRLFNTSVVFNQVKDGKIVPLTTNFEDMAGLAVGKPPSTTSTSTTSSG